MSKVYEALIVLLLVGLLVVGIVWVADSMTKTDLPNDDVNIMVSDYVHVPLFFTLLIVFFSFMM